MVGATSATQTRFELLAPSATSPREKLRLRPLQLPTSEKGEKWRREVEWNSYQHFAVFFYLHSLIGKNQWPGLTSIEAWYTHSVE